MSEKQELFCQFYISHLNATRAYKEAGYSVKSDNAAGVEGYKLLRNPKIAKRIAELKEARANKVGVDAEWVLTRLINQAEGNVLDAFELANNEALSLEDLKALPRELQMCIKKIKQTRDGIEIQFEDKQRALEMIARHIGFFNADNISKVVNIPYADWTDEQIEDEYNRLKDEA